jgi:ABC-type Fe3+ transport system substrate-binding protein
MPRPLFLILFALVLALPFLMRLALLRRQAPGGAASASSPRLVIVTPMNRDIRYEFEHAFNRWHQAHFGQAVDIDFRTPGGTNDVRRLLENTYRAYRNAAGQIRPDAPADIQIVWGGGDFFFDQELKPLGLLQPMKFDPKLLAAAFPQPTLAGVKLFDQTRDADGRPTPQWVGVCLSSFGICYNADLYHRLGLPSPRQWHDLADPRLAGFVALADPAHSGSAAVAFMVVLQRAMADAEEAFFRDHPSAKDLSKIEWSKNPEYRHAIAAGWKQGMRTLVLIAANARYFSDSSPMVPNDVGNGQAAAGMVIDFYGRVFQEAVGDRCRFIVPVAATAITPDPVAILHGVKGEPLTLATRFVEFLLSPEGQRLWILKPGIPDGPRQYAMRRPPIRPDLYADRAGWTDDTNPFTEAGGFNQRGEWMTLFTDTRMIWSAAWLDSRESLKSAYASILAIPDPARRAEMLARLSDIPIEMSDVEQIQKQRKAADAAGVGDECNAKARIHWGQVFAEHYRRAAIRPD